MVDLPIFPDAVEEVRDWLVANVDVPVFVKILNDRTTPRGRQPKFVQLDLTGGRQANLVTDGARISFQTWAPTKAEAHDLAQQVRHLVKMLPQERGPVRKVTEMSGPVDFPDPLTDSERFQFVLNVFTRGAAQALGS